MLPQQSSFLLLSSGYLFSLIFLQIFLFIFKLSKNFHTDDSNSYLNSFFVLAFVATTLFSIILMVVLPIKYLPSKPSPRENIISIKLFNELNADKIMACFFVGFFIEKITVGIFEYFTSSFTAPVKNVVRMCESG